MSTFNDREQQTIKEHCGDWVLYSVDELENQLADERAKATQQLEAQQNVNEKLLKELHDVRRTETDLRHQLFDAKQQLADERAKVAKIDRIEKLIEGHSSLPCDLLKMVSALPTLQSTDVLADIRREVARECAGIADREAEFNLHSRAKFIDGSETWLIWESRRLEAELIADAIRAKFGVSE
jgi:hypothetical protein